jgi:hypothetical protein
MPGERKMAQSAIRSTFNNGLGRRDMMLSGGAAASTLALMGCAGAPPLRSAALPPVRASADRIIKITVCTRPFRADGPRLDVENVAGKVVVHNYGHGGSGWSLSWGSSAIAVRKAMSTGARNIAVIGCGALGMTSAILLQRAGVAVTIYAKDRPPDVRSSLATGLWTPDSRICLAENATPAFKRVWEEMCRTSYRSYSDYLGLPGDPVEWIDLYHLSGSSIHTAPVEPEPSVRFAELEGELVPDLIPTPTDFAPDASPFPGRHARRRSSMMFNLTEYQRVLMSDFLEAGGHIETREFHTPADFASLPQTTLINATGYGARALMGDLSVIPVRGQLARLIPQPEIHYGLSYDDVSLVPRRDGLVVQAFGGGEGEGYGDPSTEPDRAAAEEAVATIERVFAPAARA